MPFNPKAVHSRPSALIPGVMVTATNTATGIVTTVLSNESGTYQFASLQKGTYKVHAELPALNAANRKDDKTLELQRVLVTLCMRVEGPILTPQG